VAIHQQGNALVCVAEFLNSGAAATGLTVGVDIYEIGQASGGATLIVSSGVATEIARGAYYYRLPSSNVDLNALYLFIFFTGGTADQKVTVQGWSVGMTWVENLNASVSSVAASVWSAGTRTLTSFGTVVADTALAVWIVPSRTLTSFGTLVADVWSYGTRTLTSFGALVGDAAAAVWNALASAYNTAGTMGEKLNAAGGDDPWAVPVPGSYPAGSAGEVLGNLETSIVGDLSGSEITIVSPFNPTTAKLTIVRGDDYPAGAIPPFTSTSWDDLTNAVEVRMTVRYRTPSTGAGGEVIFTTTDVEVSRVAGGGEQSVTFELTTEQTTLLTPGNNTGKWDIQATLASGALRTLATGLMDVVEDQTR
jgi:hypothetical protein